MPSQYLFPVNSAGSSINTWLNSDGSTGNAFQRINEGIASATDSDYVIYQSGASTSPAVSMGRLLVVPSSVSFTYRASGDATINSITLRDTNDLIIASTTGAMTINGTFTNRTVSLTGQNLDTRNYGNTSVQFNFSETPEDVAFSAMDMRVSGDLNVMTSSMTLFTWKDPVKRIRYPAQSDDRAWTNGFSSGFGSLPEELFPLTITGFGGLSSQTNLFLYQNNSIIIRPSGDAGSSGIWINSSGTTSNMWDYVNDRLDNSFTDNDYIYNLQSGIRNLPDKLIWISDSGIFSSELDGNNISKISDSNSTVLNAMHGCYDIISDMIYYSNEIGTVKRIGFVKTNNSYENYSAMSNGGALGIDTETNSLFSLSKEGYFTKIHANGNPTTLTYLAGNFRESPNRRIRVDSKNRHIYAIAQDQTSTLSRLFRYSIDTSGWTQLRTLSYGLFGGAFDIDVANSSIYYAGSPNDLSSTSFYGIIKENMYSGAGARIIEPNGAEFFQCQELIYDSVHSGLYYIEQDNSTSSLNYRTVKTDINGNFPTTIHTIPEASGANVLMLNGPGYRSWIDFHLTDFDEVLGSPENPNKTIGSAFVSAEVENFNGYSYINARILTADKSQILWESTVREAGPIEAGSGIQTVRIGRNTSYINQNLNTNDSWDNAILRLELTSMNDDNSGNFRVYNTEVSLSVNRNITVTNNIPLFMYGKDISSESISLWTMAGVSNGSIPLWTMAAIDSSGDATLTTHGFDSINNGITLYMPSAQKESGSLNIFISGLTPVELSGGTTLYTVGGDPNAVKHMPLFVKVDGSANTPYGKMNLFTISDGIQTSLGRMNMFLKSEPIIAADSATLYLSNNSSGVTNFTTLYLETRQSVPDSGWMPLFIQRDTESLLSTTPLYLEVNDGTNSGVPLYLYAMTKSYSSLDLVMPEVIGSQSGVTRLYINGF